MQIGARATAAGMSPNFRMQATAGGAGVVLIEGEASPAAPDLERSPHWRQIVRARVAIVRGTETNATTRE
jgi:hypothetical protein